MSIPKFLFLFFISCLNCTSYLKAQNMPMGLDSIKLYLSFNNGANDVSGNGNHGIANDVTPTTDRYGNFNKAFYFNGINSSIIIPNIVNLNRNLQEYTILISLQPEYLNPISPLANGSTEAKYNFFSWHRSKPDSLDAFLEAKSRLHITSIDTLLDVPSFKIRNFNKYCTSGINSNSEYNKDTNAIINKWFTLAIVYNRGNLKIYHNCEVVININDGLQAFSDLCGTEPMQITIGSVPESAKALGFVPFKGKIDELSVFSRALTNGEVYAYAGALCAILQPSIPIKPIINFKNDTCNPNTFTFVDRTNYAGGIYQKRIWRIGNTDSSELNTFTKKFLNLGPVNIRLEVTFDSGIVKYTDTTIYVTNLQSAKFLVVPQSNIYTCKDVAINLFASGGVTYLWQPCNLLNNCNIANPILNNAINTNFKILATNQLGCIDSTTITINTLDSDNLKIYAPTAFTPNNDGLNDGFGILTDVPLNYYQLSIYNRWGKKIFTSYNQQTKWKPPYKNGEPNGSYTWVLEYITLNGCNLKKAFGMVNIIR